ncbi:hypothetical protein ACFY0G_17605 [Streptomyces sp. NPDC001552]|uniref:hypothetical protein n=1 Tax=Streptomyces sp. NPDC001552 TaxID=3364587 RepID=UPI0036973180
MPGILTVLAARDIRPGDTLRGYYRPGVTLSTAVHPDRSAADWSDLDRRAGLLGRPFRATASGLSALTTLRTRQRFTDDSPILVTREPAGRLAPLTESQTDELGDAVGRIAGFAAKSLHKSFPHLSLEGFVEAFTSPGATSMLAARYLKGLERGLTAGEAAADAGTTLIDAWAEARLETRAQLDREAAHTSQA